MNKTNFLFYFIFAFHSIFSQTTKSIDEINSVDYTYISNNLKKCETEFKLNIKNAEKLNYEKGLAKSYKNLALVQALIGDYKESIQSNLYALKIYEKNNDFKEIAITNADIAYRIRYIDYEQAINYFRKAIFIAKKHRIERELTSIYNNYGETIKNNDLDSALYFFKKSLELAIKYNELVSIPFSLNKIAESYAKKKEFEKAFKYLAQSDEIRFKTNDSIGISDNIAYKADIFFEIPQIDSAIFYYEKSLKIAERRSYNSLQRFCLQRLAELYQRKNEYEKAYITFKKYKNLEDSVLNGDVKKSMANLEIKYGSEKAKRELAENEIKLESRKKWLLITIGLIVMLIFSAYFIYRNQKTKRINEKKEAELNRALKAAEIEKQFIEEKLRIGRELHDNIGSHLTFMISSLDNLAYFEDANQRIEKISDLSNFGRLTMKDLRDTIWAMNHEGGTFEHLIARISELRSVLPSNLNVSIQSDIDLQKTLNGLQLLNCYRIVQEFIQNTIKYANASEIKIYIIEKNSHFELNISDNGKGFDLKNISFGNGVLNMKRRCEDLNGEFEIRSSNEGTTILCSIPF